MVWEHIKNFQSKIKCSLTHLIARMNRDHEPVEPVVN